MLVFGFQIFFFILILISGLFGKKVRNFVVIGSLIFTVIMVFMTWLIILQFITIIFAYFITEAYVENSGKKLENLDKSYGDGCLTLIVVGGILMIVLKVVSGNKSNQTDSEESTIIQIDSVTADTMTYSESTVYSDQISTESLITDFDTITEVEQTNFDEIKTENSSVLTTYQVINNFILSENRRDFNLMSLYLSDNKKRFWNIKNPREEQISNSYNKTWSQYGFTYTEILEIIEINPYHSIVKVRFYFDGKSNINFINFEFDDKNNITAIY